MSSDIFGFIMYNFHTDKSKKNFINPIKWVSYSDQISLIHSSSG